MNTYHVSVAVCFEDHTWEPVFAELEIPCGDEMDPTEGEFIEYFQSVYSGHPEKNHVAMGLIWWEHSNVEEDEE